MASGKQHQLPPEGSRAPDFRLARLDGTEVSLAEILAGGPALLAFFKITCPVCQLTLPFLERIHAAGTLQVFAISQNDARDTREFNEDFGITLPTLLDAEESGYPVSNAYGISSVPTLFLIDPDGRISRIFEGWRKRDIEWLGQQNGTEVIRPGEYVPEWKAG